MAQLTGRAAVYGVKGSVTFMGIAANVILEPQSAEYSDEFEVDELKNKSGEVIGMAARNDRLTATLDVIPVADPAGNTIANAEGGLKLPAKLSKITISGMPHADQNGDWSYMGGGRISLTNEGYAKMTLPAKKFPAGVADAVA